jgi:hypothetical protein
MKENRLERQLRMTEAILRHMMTRIQVMVRITPRVLIQFLKNQLKFRHHDAPTLRCWPEINIGS